MGNSVMKPRSFALCIAFVVLEYGATAHHGAVAIYNREAPVTIRGTITRYEWRNPHVYLYVEENTGSAEPPIWEIEGPPPAILRRFGWTDDTVGVGDMVTVDGFSGRAVDRRIALMQSLTKADGTVLNTQLLRMMTSLPRVDAAVALTQATSIGGTWTTSLDMNLIGRFQLPTPPQVALTEKGQLALANSGEAADAPAVNCVPMSAPMLMLTPDIKSIEVRPNVVMIRGEFDASERTVYLDVDSHDGAAESVQGHSIGRWDGGTLIIDTTQFAPRRTGGGLPSGSRKHLVERLALTNDRSHLTYEFNLEDPEYLASPLSGAIQWAFRPDLDYQRLPCDLDNARRFLQ